MPQEVTQLDPLEEQLFQKWIQENIDAPGMKGWDQPDAKYDIRGFFHDKDKLSQWKPGDHGPDTYKQHGHPTFSNESKYSKGSWDGGRWAGETYLPQLATSRYPGMSPDQMESSLMQLLMDRK